MTSASQTRPSETVSRLLSALAILSAGVAVTVLLLPNPLADVFYSGIVLLSILFALVGGIGAWTNRTPLVWVAALLLGGLSILGMMSIGLYLVPAALLLLGAAVFSQLTGPRPGVRESILANPSTRRDIVQKILVGTVAIVVGLGLVSVGAFRRELFGSCARETLDCALKTTNWDAVGLTVLGLVAISFGGWLVWRQAYITRVLAANTGSVE
ncbi:hypothetical protein [Haloarcula amylovorans]|uniref:hypothetical protein n=1 Tax=Haloarcula amylovorans TaxID=2562280 RepID=UPI001075CE9C|nr:hypothetical protein [Halomicroarcula amylolytica]